MQVEIIVLMILWMMARLTFEAFKICVDLVMDIYKAIRNLMTKRE